MTGNVTFLGNIADWFDDTTNRVIALRDRALEWVDPTGNITGRDHPYRSGLSGNPIAYVIAGQNLSLTLLQGMVDTLRFGNGIRDGGWGYAQDGLRGIAVLVPAFRGVRYVRQFAFFNRFGRAAGAVAGSGAGPAAPIAIAQVGNPLFVQPAGTMSCTAVSSYNAVRRLGYQVFASVQELARLSGISDTLAQGRGLYANELRNLFAYLRLAGVSVSEFAASTLARWSQFERLVAANPRGVFLVTIRYVTRVNNATTEVWHTLEAFYRPASGVRFYDTSGLTYDGVAALRQAYELATIHPAYPIGFVHDSAVVAELGREPATRAVLGFSTWIRLIPIFATGAVGAQAAEAAMARAPAPGGRPALVH
jgi:hypothetical protein